MRHLSHAAHGRPPVVEVGALALWDLDDLRRSADHPNRQRRQSSTTCQRQRDRETPEATPRQPDIPTPPYTAAPEFTPLVPFIRIVQARTHAHIARSPFLISDAR